jgi:hypothetical protein
MPKKDKNVHEIPEAHNEEEQRSRGDDSGEQTSEDIPPQPKKSEDNPWLKWKDTRKV